MKWAITTALSLIALQALVTNGASGRVGQFFADANRLLERALDPTVPAIPDRRGLDRSTYRGDVPLTSDGSPKTATRVQRPTTDQPTPRLPIPGQQRPV